MSANASTECTDRQPGAEGVLCYRYFFFFFSSDAIV